MNFHEFFLKNKVVIHNGPGFHDIMKSELLIKNWLLLNTLRNLLIIKEKLLSIFVETFLLDHNFLPKSIQWYIDVVDRLTG